MFLKSKTYATKAKSNTTESPHHPLVERFFYYRSPAAAEDSACCGDRPKPKERSLTSPASPEEHGSHRSSRAVGWLRNANQHHRHSTLHLRHPPAQIVLQSSKKTRLKEIILNVATLVLRILAPAETVWLHNSY